VDAIEKINWARRRDREVLVRQQAHQKNQFIRQLPFRKFRPQPKLALKEEVVGEDILDTVSLFILHGSDLGDQRLAVSELCERLIQMAQIGSVSVIGIVTKPDS
jgi:hypothetical protein